MDDVGWACPKCLRRFRRVGQAHECSPAMSIEEYFSTGPAHERPIFEAVMAHWLLVSPRLVRSVRGAGGEIYVWTVDDGRRIERLEALGVDGVITNDPRLFAPRPA